MKTYLMLKKILYKIWVIATIALAIVYIIQSFSPYVSEADHPLYIILSLGYLFILVAFILVALSWLFIKRRIFLVLFILFFAGYKNFRSSVGISIPTSFKMEKDTNTLRIMSWNVREFNNTPDYDNNSIKSTNSIIALLNADIVCLQDVIDNPNFIKLDKNSAMLYQNNYNYRTEMFFLRTFGLYPEYYTNYGLKFISKYPILNSGKILVPGNNPFPEYLGFIDIVFKNKPVRIYTTHLKSMALWPGEKSKSGANYFKGDSTLYKLKKTYNKLVEFKKIHTQQAEFIKAELNKSQYPIVFCGDLNSVPTSYVYQHLKKGLNDVFIEKGLGIDGTYNRIFPKQRIDVMLTDKAFTIKQYKRFVIDKTLSDHYPIVADIAFE